MQIKVSESIGFCYGVKNAVELSEKALSNKKGSMFSLGPIIHNPQVVEELSRKGLKPVSDLDGIKEGTLIISSHGAGARIGREKGFKIIDATCPFVKKIQRYVKNLYDEGYKVIIVGKKEHPEVKGLIDFTDGTAIVIKDKDEAGKIDPGSSRIGIVSQSTYSRNSFQDVVSIFIERSFSEIRIFNTICSDTIKRQDAAKRLTDTADAVIVVGGKESSNTRRLVEVCRKEGGIAYHVESWADIDPAWLDGKESVGIASGASTPEKVVQNIIKEILLRRA